MPDLPELYEALDIELAYIVGRQRVKFSDGEMDLMTSIVSALCAAIEIKQTQELHEFLNEGATWSHAGTPEEMWDKMDEENTTATGGSDD